jgi:hypothetical protein
MSTPRNLTVSPAVIPLTDSLKRMRYVTSSRWPVFASQTKASAAASENTMMNSPSKK